MSLEHDGKLYRIVILGRTIPLKKRQSADHWQSDNPSDNSSHLIHSENPHDRATNDT